MSYRQILKQLHMNETDFYARLDWFINKLKTSAELAKESYDISIEVLCAIKNGVRFNISPRNITKEKLEKALSVFEKMAELEVKDEDEKLFVKTLADMARQLIRRNPDIRKW